ncbi:siderophore biosynthesis protein (malonyl-CoA decarboxylase-like protein) [Haloferax mucosum ATCC BAA-1512]|uniref:Siderophore biosynthesis protein (Malonyl-CoA decarboxylase-like protein) n=1 Tax=Haloferax mucosum ATCC BAA-1512 TaxID=662479 RepID=M0IGI9_9EURY|nr:GNAT family N-acetyltransferase [Haloferax mucosum]ELZ95886.1 siderophore biosynthesis protein (malonyl-CoA decarboxylase-like protein) [Haloferax mucosum ATCC BAA-1512]
MTAATVETERQEYAYEVYDETIDRTIGFAELELERDFDRLHTWFGYDHVKPDWQLDLPRSEFRLELDAKVSDDHLTLYIGYIDHVPMSYWETYDAKDDVLSECYDVHPDDRGIHVLLGPPEYVARGYGTAMIQAITAFQFETTDAKRIVGEPDIRSERTHHVLDKCHFDRKGEISLPDKDAMLVHCERDRFYEESAYDE